MAMFAAGEKFLAQYLGGRYQEWMTPEVAKRLGEINVDPKTVTMVKKAEGAVTSSTSGTVGTAGVDGKWIWVVEAPGQTVELSVDLKQEGAAFAGTSVSMIGNATFEKGKVSGKTITAVLKAEVQGQPMDFAVEGTVDGDKITGTITGGAFGTLPFTATRAK